MLSLPNFYVPMRFTELACTELAEVSKCANML